MSIISGLIAGIGAIQMLVTVGKETWTYADEANQLDSQIESAKQAQKDYQDRFDKIFAGQAAEEQALGEDIKKSLDSILTLQNSLDIAKTKAALRYRAIQLTGIIFISSFLFLYILKYFGILKDIEDSIFNGFKSLFGMKK